MNAVDIIVIAVLAVIVGLAAWYIIRAKKSGKKCIGCPDGCCSSKKKEENDCSCGCGGCAMKELCHSEKEK